MTNNRRSPIVPVLSRNDDPEARAEAGLGPQNGSGFNSYVEDISDDKVGMVGKHTFANGKEHNDWSGLSNHARLIGKQWKRGWDRDGFKG
jgi:hypothetical protein